jgi:transcriptional regulator with XRE-family HTH domain
MQINTTVADTVRAEMARRRVTQGQIAAKLHLSQAAVSRRLNGDVAFNADELIEIARVIRVPVSVLFGEHANPSPVDAPPPTAASTGDSSLSTYRAA